MNKVLEKVVLLPVRSLVAGAFELLNVSKGLCHQGAIAMPFLPVPDEVNRMPDWAFAPYPARGNVGFEQSVRDVQPVVDESSRYVLHDRPVSSRQAPATQCP